MNVDTTKKSPTILSLCPGMLGLERGLERAIGPVDPIAYVETEAFIVNNLVRQMEQGLLAPRPVWSDVKTFLHIARRLRGYVDIITGGYPCQPFSHVGQQLGVEDPRHLWPYIEDITDAVRPRGCFFENVSNHLNIGYREVRSSLEKMGYQVEEGIFSAEEVGAPHIRKRLFILAVANTDRERRWFKQLVESCPRGWPRGQSEWISGKLVDANGALESQSIGVIGESGRRVEYTGEKLGDTAVKSEREPTDEANSITNEKSARRESGDASSELDDPLITRLEGYTGNDSAAGGRQVAGRSVTAASFPMGQGYNQYDWEAPRLESSMGLTVNGYNYREDLLRMAGNAVVEQTAEFAFRTLIKKIKM